jgi:hypothetical protein
MGTEHHQNKSISKSFTELNYEYNYKTPGK